LNKYFLRSRNVYQRDPLSYIGWVGGTWEGFGWVIDNRKATERAQTAGTYSELQGAFYPPASVLLHSGSSPSFKNFRLFHFMKTTFWVALLFSFVLNLPAQRMGANGQTVNSTAPHDTPYAIVQNDANSRVWERTTYEQLPSGEWIPHVHRYQETATGLNYKNPDTGRWEESSEQIEQITGGAVARHGQHKVTFAADIATYGAIDMETPDGQKVQSHLLGLSYYDTASGQSVMIAEITNCIGQIVGTNQVWYEGAFSGIKAAVRYTYTREGFEQDIILEERPQPPEAYGLNSSSTVLQALTEFVSYPAPTLSTSVSPMGLGLQMPDETVKFGAMKIGRGRAFLMGTGSGGVPVCKEWLTLDGRQFLVEEVPVTDVTAQMHALPLTQSASLKPGPDSIVNVVSTKRLLPPQPLARVETKPMKFASRSVKNSGFVLDYNSLNTSQTNYTFRGDTTYYISGNVSLYGTNTTFEGGTVLKYASNVSLTVSTPVNWRGEIYRPIVMLAKDDNTSAETLSDSTGYPGTNYYAAKALCFDGTAALTNLTVDNLRILNAQAGVVINGRSNHVLSNVQIVKCATGIAATNTDFSLRNALFSSVLTNFSGSSATGRVEHLTSDVAIWLNKDIGTNLFLTNCILSAVTNLGSCTTQSVAVVSSGSGVFQPTGAGGYYLTNNSPYRNAGTTNINSALLAQLSKKTTYPPVLILNSNFNALTTLGPIIQRDTDTPDLGYHYDPMDYVLSGVTVNTNMTISAGTAIGWFRPSSGNQYAIFLADKVVLAFNGRVDAQDYFVRTSTAQEGNGTWAGISGFGIVGSHNQNVEDISYSSEIDMNFTSMSVLISDQQFRDYWGYLIARANNSTFAGGNVGGYLISSYFTNCLMDNQQVGTVYGYPGNEVYLRNCTLHDGVFYGQRAEAIPISVRDCAFDQVTLYGVFDSYSSNPTNTDYSYNAYTNSTDPFPNPTGTSHDQTSVTFNWQTGPLGRFYLPTNSVLIDTGHTNANLLGLYHFTTQTNQVKEANSKVDIGYHYVAIGCNKIDLPWMDDAVPAGAALGADGGDSWATWVSSNPTPFSGALASQSNIGSGEHQHYFYSAVATLMVNPGETLIAYVYLDPANPPSEVMLQWNDGTWEHRAYWGANYVGFGVAGTISRYYAGGLPPVGQWVRLEVPASLVGLEGHTLNGVAFTLYGGRATWDYAGKTGTFCYDTDGDGVPDYLADANGNGLDDLGETPWDGPHYESWTCNQQGSFTNIGFLDITNADVAPGDPFPVGVAYDAGISTGQKQRWVWYNSNSGMDHYETNTVSYVWTNVFNPSLPASINVPGTNVYAVYLVGTPVGGVCGSVTQALCNYTVTVWPNIDSDYDGMLDWQEALFGGDLYNANNSPEIIMGHWGFETLDWSSDSGAVPLTQTNLQRVVGHSGYGIKINNPGGALLAFSESRTNGMPNINLAAGTVRFWFKPDWNSTNSGGSGPQTDGRLIEVGNTSTNTSTDWWTLRLDRSGNYLQFITQTNGAGMTNLTAAINWNSNTWYDVMLTYGPSNSILYVNGQSVGSGSGVSRIPNASVRSNGFRIGSDQLAQNQVKGSFDDFTTYNRPLDSNAVAAAYSADTDSFAANQTECELRPIAIPNGAIAGLGDGNQFTLNMSDQPGPGNFGWLVWNPQNESEPTLANSLLNPNSDTYVNPRDGSDHVLNAGDWVSGMPGLKAGVVSALNSLVGVQLILPKYSETQGNGANLQYHVSGFINATLSSVNFHGNSKALVFTYHGVANCDIRVDVPPAIAFSDQAITTYVENDPARIIDSAFQLADSDSPDFDGGSLTVSIVANGDVNDRLVISSVGGIVVNGASVSYQGSAIGTFSGGQGTTPLVVSFSGSYSTPNAAQALMRAVAYQTVSTHLSGSRTIQVVANDGDGNPWMAGSSQPATHTIDLVPVNHAPTLDPFAFRPIWQNGVQFWRFSDVAVSTSGQLTVTVLAGIGGRASISGLQIVDKENYNRLLNIDFGAGSVSPKSGKAAVGLADTDFWNFYDHGSEFLGNLNYADGSSSAAHLSVQNDPYAANNGSADPMYNSFIYDDTSSITLTLSGLPLGQYDVYTYGDNGVFRITSSGINSSGTSQESPVMGGIVNGGSQTITLTGITDGGDGGQSLTIQPVSDNPDVTPSIDYSNPQSSGGLTVRASSTASAGVANITVTVMDSGGTANGGVDQFPRSAQIRIIPSSGVNHPPTLTSVQTLKATRENTAFPISYETLLAASDASDPDGNPISFRIIGITSGTLKKSGVSVQPGVALLRPGEALTWTPPLNQNGSAVAAFTTVANDGNGLESSPQVQVSVEVDPANNPPIVSAGDDINQDLSPVTLHGSASDPDGRLSPLTVWWTKVSGPGDATFVNPNDPATTVTFSQAGNYVLRLFANDGEFTVSDDVNIGVCAQKPLPLDMIILLDVSGSMTSDTESFAAAKTAISNLVARLHFTGSADTDKIGFIPIGDTPNLCSGNEEESILSGDPESIQGYLDADYSSASSHEDFEPAIREAIDQFKQDTRTRLAKPLLVFISDFGITRFEDGTGDILTGLANGYKAEGVRAVTLGFNLDSDFQRQWWSTLASSPGDQFESDDVFGLPAIVQSVSTTDCQANGIPLCVFTPDNRTNQYQSGGVVVTLPGTVLDFRSVLEPAPTIVWTVDSMPQGSSVSFTPVTAPSTSVTIQNPVSEGDYVFRLSASIGGQESHDLVTVHLSDVVNNPPVARCDKLPVQEDSIDNTLDVLANDSDVDGDELLITSIASPPQHGTLKISADSKTLLYTPDPNYNGLDDGASYVVSDNKGGTATANVEIDVLPVNDPATANPDTFVVSRSDSNVPLDVLRNDPNVDTDEYRYPTDPAHGYTIVGVSPLQRDGGGDPGQLTPLSGGDTLLYYTPVAGSGTYTVHFTYTIQDPHGSTASAQVTITATDGPINHAPAAVDDSVMAWTGTTPTFQVLNNDSDPDGNDISVTSMGVVSVPGDPAPDWKNYFDNNGSQPNYPLVFHPKKLDGTGSGTLGKYVFTYTITDDGNPPLSASATLQIQLSEPGPAPIARDDSFQTQEGTSSAPLSPLANDGPDPNVLHIQSFTQPTAMNGSQQHGTVTQVTGTDQLVYTPPAGYYGSDSFTYTAVDPGGRTATATVNITVYNPNSTGVVRAQLTKQVLTTDQQSALSAAGCDENQPEAVRDGVLNVTGVADDSDTQDSFFYDITVQNSDGVQVASSHGVTRVSDATPPNSLANIDLRAMPDGIYEVDLTVHGGLQTQSDSKQILLQSNYKIGNLKFSEVDATINVGGVPLQVTRSYDSVNASAGKGGEDFGAGWAYDLDDLHFEFDETREQVTDDNGDSYSRRSGGGRDVSLVLPDGRKAVFAFKPRVDDSAVFIAKYYAEWTCTTPGVAATLTSDTEDSEQIIASFDGSLLYWNGNSQTSVEKYDLSRFLLTLPDGTSIHVQRDFEGAHDYSQQSQTENDVYVETYGKARITEIDTRTGERYFFTKDRVSHQSPGQLTTAPVLKIQRDPVTHLISAIYDLSGIDPQSGEVLPNAQAVVVYDYDQSTPPRLIHVRRLREHSATGNTIYDTTTYEYGDPLHPNLITDVLDSRGVKMAQTTYDDQGRMIKIEQPNGRYTEFHHDDVPTAPGAVARERIVDSEGNTTIHDTDSNGNLLLTIDALQNQTSRMFDTLNNGLLTQETRDAAGNLLLRTVNDSSYYDDGTHNQVNRRITSEGTGANPSQSVQMFDPQGNLIQSVDARHTPAGTGLDTDLNGVFCTLYQYSDNQPTVTTAHRPNSTDLELSQNTYFPDGQFKGLLEESTDAGRTRTDYSYYDGVTDSQKGRFGDLKATATTDSTGNPLNQTEYEYDASGNRTKETRDQWNGSSWTPYSVTEYVYDGQGRAKETIDAEGGHSYTSYDADGRVISRTDRYGATTQYSYDAVGDLIQTEYPDNTIARSVTYYQVESEFSTKPLRHMVTEDRHTVDAPAVNGSVTIYDELGRSVASDRMKNLVVQLAPDGLVQKAIYVSGERANTAASAPHDTVTKYDGVGRTTMTEDAASHWTKTEYDDKGRQWRTSSFVNPDGSPIGGVTIVTLCGYDASGNQLWALDPNQYDYFAANDPSAVSGNAASTWVYLFEDVANRAYLTWHEYDDFGRNLKTHQPSVDGIQAVTESRYDDAGRRWMTVDADGNGTVFVYDGSGRLAWVITAVDPAVATALPSPLPANWFTYTWSARWPDSTVTHYTYDNLGRLNTQTDANQHTTLFEYDRLDRRTKRTLPDTSYETWVYDFDTATGAESTSDPRPDKIRHRDFAGRYVLSISDITGRLISHAPAGQESGVTPLPVAATRAVSFTYTSAGQRATMVEGQTSLDQVERHTYYAYDELNRLRIKNTPEGILSYDYDALGNVTEISARRGYSKSTGDADFAVFDPMQLGSDGDRPNGALMNYYYDGRNRLQTVAGDSISATYGYDTSGNLKSVNYGNGVLSTFQYNPRNQLRYKDDGSLASFDYDDYNSEGWDSARKLTPSGMRQGFEERITFGGQDYRRRVAYDYDPLHRLRAERMRSSTGANWPAWAPTAVPTTPAAGDALYDVTPGYGDGGGYDPVGNRRSRASSGVNVITSGGSVVLQNQSGLAYDANDRLNFVASPASYDPNGNATYQAGYVSQATPAEVQPDSTHPDEYDFENRLIHRHNVPADITMVYDGDGNRVNKNISGNLVIQYLVDDRNPTGYPQVLEEQDGSGNPTATYVYGLDLISQQRSGAITYYGRDGHGSVRYLTDSSGAVSDTYTYDAFGNLTDTKHAGTPTQNYYRYAGEQWDSALGMYYLRARYYKPDTGRFWAMDSFGGQQEDPLSLHKYLYCADSPINAKDPSGHDTLPALVTTTGIMLGLSAWMFSPMVANAPANVEDASNPMYSSHEADMVVNIFGGFIFGKVVGVGATALKFGYSKLVTYVSDTEVRIVQIRTTAPLDDLPPGVRASFRGGTFLRDVAKEDIIVYRAEGGTSKTFGRFFGLTKPVSALDAEEMSNIIKYDNELTTLSTYRIKAGTTIFKGGVEGGAGDQIFIPDPVKAGVELIGSEPLPLNFVNPLNSTPGILGGDL
jgi:RHS repeat-associated protein